MAKESFIEKFARENELVDERNIITCADITCSNGNNGRAWIFLKGSNVHLYECVGFNIGDYVETIDLKGITDFKSCKVILLHYMKFVSNGYNYKFTGFSQPSKIIAAFVESSNH